jgi:hypothetical protein
VGRRPGEREIEPTDPSAVHFFRVAVGRGADPDEPPVPSQRNGRTVTSLINAPAGSMVGTSRAPGRRPRSTHAISGLRNSGTPISVGAPTCGPNRQW